MVMYFVFKRVIIQFLILSFLLLFRQRFSSSHQKMLSFWYPRRGLSYVWRESSVSAKGRRYERQSREKKTLFVCGTMNEDMTETGNRARKVSGRQGIILFLVK